MLLVVMVFSSLFSRSALNDLSLLGDIDGFETATAFLMRGVAKQSIDQPSLEKIWRPKIPSCVLQALRDYLTLSNLDNI